MILYCSMNSPEICTLLHHRRWEDYSTMFSEPASPRTECCGRASPPKDYDSTINSHETASPRTKCCGRASPPKDYSTMYFRETASPPTDCSTFVFHETPSPRTKCCGTATPPEDCTTIYFREAAWPRTDCCRRESPPRTVWDLVAVPANKQVRELKSIPNVTHRRPFYQGQQCGFPTCRSHQGRWHECGCSRSMLERYSKVDLTPRQHMHTVPLDEAVLHYIFDRQAYVKINQLASQKAQLKQWMLERCKEGRLFVAKPPPMPPSTEPWGYDPPPKLGTLEPGWRAWEPRDLKLTITAWNSGQEYRDLLETFFLFLNVAGKMKADMTESGEAWILACGEETDHLKVRNRRPCKLDRCFVTNDMDLYEILLAKWHRMSSFPRSLRCGNKMTYVKRLMDIRLDTHHRSSDTRVDPCKKGLVDGRPLCSKNGQYKLRPGLHTAPFGATLLSPRSSPRTRARKADELACSGTRWLKPFLSNPDW